MRGRSLEHASSTAQSINHFQPDATFHRQCQIKSKGKSEKSIKNVQDVQNQEITEKNQESIEKDIGLQCEIPQIIDISNIEEVNQPQETNQKEKEQKQIHIEYTQPKNDELKITKSSKDELILILQDRNSKMRKQIFEITNKLNKVFELNASLVQPKHSSIFPITSDLSQLNAELTNAYYHIRTSEKEIQRYRSGNQRNKSDNNRISSLHKQINQKIQLRNKKREECKAIKKKVESNEKKLTDKEYQLQLIRQLKNVQQYRDHMQVLTKQLQKTEANRMAALKKQYLHIKQMQKQALTKGLTQKDLQILKYKSINEDVAHRRIVMIDDSKPILSYMESIAQVPSSSQTQEIQDRTRDHYEELLSQINLLQKVQQDFIAKQAILDKERIRMLQLNGVTEEKIKRLDQQIIDYENMIEKMRNKVVIGGKSKEKSLRTFSLGRKTKTHKTII